MISFQTISSFRGRLEELVLFKRGVYAGAQEEIKAAFRGIPIEQIRANRDMVLMQDDAIVIKLRLLTSPSGELKINSVSKRRFYCYTWEVFLVHVGKIAATRGRKSVCF